MVTKGYKYILIQNQSRPASQYEKGIYSRRAKRAAQVERILAKTFAVCEYNVME